MSQISQLLLYQAKDSELIRIEREISTSDERKEYAKANGFMKKASDKLDQLEAKSRQMLSRLNELNERYEELAETLKDFDHLDELVESGADLSFYKRNANQIATSLKTLKEEIASLISDAQKTVKEYEALKKEVIAAQRQYPDIKKKYQDFAKERQQAIESISAELDKLSCGIDEEILRRYQAKRSERIFPIICEIKNGRCSKCGTELSLADKEKAASNVVECENCHRFLYQK